MGLALPFQKALFRPILKPPSKRIHISYAQFRPDFAQQLVKIKNLHLSGFGLPLLPAAIRISSRENTSPPARKARIKAYVRLIWALLPLGKINKDSRSPTSTTDPSSKTVVTGSSRLANGHIAQACVGSFSRTKHKSFLFHFSILDFRPHNQRCW